LVYYLNYYVPQLAGIMRAQTDNPCISSQDTPKCMQYITTFCNQ